MIITKEDLDGWGLFFLLLPGISSFLLVLGLCFSESKFGKKFCKGESNAKCK